MATLFELKEHLRNGGKIKSASWVEGEWIKLIGNTFVDEDGSEYPFSPEDALYCDWEVYEEPFKITHTGLYRTRNGRRAFVCFINPCNSDCFPILGVVEDQVRIMNWTRNGVLWTDEENPKDIVSEWED